MTILFNGQIGDFAGIPVVYSPLVPKGKAYIVSDLTPIILIAEYDYRFRWYEIAWRRIKRWAYIAAFGWSGAPYYPRRGKVVLTKA